MSSRVLRKLQGDNDLQQPEDVSDLDETDLPVSSSGNGGARRKQLNINRYDLLNQQSHSESEVKEDDDNETEATATKHNEEGRDDCAKRKKKKKKKKTTNKASNLNARRSSDEIERSLREVNKILGDAPVSSTTSNISTETPTKGGKNILSIQHRNLNPNNELKRIFGSKIFQNKRRPTRGSGPARGHLKQTWLVSAKDNWPQIGKPGLSMKPVVKNQFTYEHNLNYQSVQVKFLEAVESLNPDNIVSIINDHPYHVDALIQISDLCKMSDDLATAAELIERALYCLECGFHPLFSVVQGNCTLDYRRQENRALFIAIFKHLMFVGDRACYRTALEFCRLLLSLSPSDDPLGVVLTIDFYALRSREYGWLIEFFNEWEQWKNLSQLPNFAYSIAIAHYYLATTGNTDPDLETANTLLQNALIMFPGVLIPLLEKCSVQTDSRVSSHSFFTAGDNSQGLLQLIKLYVCRSHHIWKEPDLIPWLERNVHTVLDRVNSGKEEAFIADCATKRESRYVGTPRNISRHIILSDFKEVTAHLTTDTQGPVLTFDPLPPVDAINLYTRPRGPRRGANSQNSSAMSIFFQSLLPNFIVESAGNGVGDPDDIVAVPVGEGAGASVDLRRSVTSLLDAMRDLLSNIRLPDEPNHADVDENDSATDDDEDLDNYLT